MGVVDHVLIEHGIGIADDDGWHALILGIILVVLDFLARSWKEHGVYLGLSLAILDPFVFSFECLGKHLPHLLYLSKQLLEATVTIVSLLSPAAD